MGWTSVGDTPARKKVLDSLPHGFVVFGGFGLK
jgi:hypothetical protein